MNERVAVVVDNVTGEIMDEFNEGDSYKKITKEQKDIRNSKVFNFNSDKQFVKFYSDIVPSLIKYLSSTELKMVVALIPLAKHGDCTIEKTVSGHSKILSLNDIAEETGLDYDFVKRYMRALKKKGIVGVHETGKIIPNCDSKIDTVFTVNPFVFFNGKDANSNVYTFYRNSGWEELLREAQNSSYKE